MNKKLTLVALICLSNLTADAPKADSKKNDLSMTDLLKDNKTNLKVGFINSFEAMRGSKDGEVVSKELEAKRDQLTKELQKEGQLFEQLRTEYQAKGAAMSEAARSKEEEKLLKLKRSIENKSKECEEELQLSMQRATEKLAKDLEQAVIVVAQKEKMDAMIDAMTGRVLYVAPHVNYTSLTVTQMNKASDIKVAQNKTESAKPATSAAA